MSDLAELTHRYPDGCTLIHSLSHLTQPVCTAPHYLTIFQVFPCLCFCPASNSFGQLVSTGLPHGPMQSKMAAGSQIWEALYLCSYPIRISRAYSWMHLRFNALINRLNQRSLKINIGEYNRASTEMTKSHR